MSRFGGEPRCCSTPSGMASRARRPARLRQRSVLRYECAPLAPKLFPTLLFVFPLRRGFWRRRGIKRFNLAGKVQYSVAPVFNADLVACLSAREADISTRTVLNEYVDAAGASDEGNAGGAFREHIDHQGHPLGWQSNASPQREVQSCSLRQVWMVGVPSYPAAYEQARASFVASGRYTAPSFLLPSNTHDVSRCSR